MTSLRRRLITWLRDTNTAATFMPSRAGRFGTREALDRREAIGLPRLGLGALSYSPLGLLQQFPVELGLESTGQVIARLGGLDQIGSSGHTPGDRADRRRRSAMQSRQAFFATALNQSRNRCDGL